MGIGTNDAGGYKLWLVPNQQKLQLRKGDDPTPKAETAYKDWQSGQWTGLRIRVTDAGNGRWRIEGKAWPAAGKEPDAWTIRMEDDKPPSPGPPPSGASLQRDANPLRRPEGHPDRAGQVAAAKKAFCRKPT